MPDPLVSQAQAICQKYGYASSALLMLNLRIGYTRSNDILKALITLKFCEEAANAKGFHELILSQNKAA